MKAIALHLHKPDHDLRTFRREFETLEELAPERGNSGSDLDEMSYFRILLSPISVHCILPFHILIPKELPP
jgi:hypothetical protein